MIYETSTVGPEVRMRYWLEYGECPEVVSIHVNLRLVPALEVFKMDAEPVGTLAPFVRELQAIVGVTCVFIGPHAVTLHRGLAFPWYDIVVAGLIALQRHVGDGPLWEAGPPIIHPESECGETESPYAGPIH